MDTSVTFLKKFKQMQDVIQDKLDHLQQQQLDIDHLDVETKKLNDKVLLIQSDIEKDQRTLSDIKVDLVLKDIEISAAKGVANHLDLEMDSHSSKLKFIRDCTTEKKEKYQSRLHEFSLEFGYLSGAKIQEQQEQILQGLHDDSANDNSANDKMATRFSHTDDSATFLFEKKGQKFFPTPHGFHIKTFPTPYGCQKGLKLPLTGFSYPWRELIFSLKKLFLTPNWLQIGKNGLN